MEPIAPGTEDEPLVNFSASTKQEKERERLLNVKTVLPNGKYGNVFDFKYINGTEHWYCNACACPVMGWVFHHETGKRHSLALGKQNQDQDRLTSSQDVEETPTIQIAPGEPVPPGFEGEIERVALIQERLDVFNVGPLVALEYLLELRDYDSNKEPTYLCILCDKKGDPRTVLTHLASYKHILQYLQKHFPTCYRALAPYMTKQYKRNWQIALHEIAEAIEKKFGRLKPLPVEADKYEKDPVHYLELIAKGRHFSELSGHTFEELVNKDELTRVHDDETDKFSYNKANLPQSSQKKKSPSPPVVANPIKKIRVANPPPAAAGSRRRSLSSVSSVSSSDLSDYDDPKKRSYSRRSRTRSPPYRNRSRSPYSRRYDRRSPPRKEAYYRRDDRSERLMPWEKTNYRRSKPENPPVKNKTDKMDEYKKLCKAIDNDMERVLKNHKKNPEKHPQYNDEWKKFWNKRYKELQAEGKDVSTHDFKPEWIEFWNKRMIELHHEEVKVKKEALRKRLGLPEEPSPISFKIVGKKKFEPNKNSPMSSKPVPPSALPDSDPEVIIIDKDDESKSSRRSHSPWEDEPVRSSSRVSRDKSRDGSRDRSRERSIRRDKYSRSPRDRSRERSWDRDYKIKDYRRERIRIVSELPWERDRKSYRNEIPSYYKPPAVMRDVTREPVLTPPPVAPVLEEEDDGEINIVAVLRLLTALEEKLGSLGPKVIDLLAQALAMEKNEANSSENLLDNEINCVMFETVKEKLKGQLLAGLVEPIQEKAFKNAIKKTASLIHLAGERKKEKAKNQPKVDPVKVPGVGTVDKAAIAKQIANALILQGKTDVTQAELEQLINAVVGMAEASRNSNKPITTASFLEQISKAGSSKEKTPPKEVVKPPAPVVAERVTKSPEKMTNKDMEGLSDSDLQTLLQNFKDLSTEEQHSLINYLKKLEAREPDRVERLRKFVNLGQPREKPPEEKKMGRESPFSNRMGSVNPSVEENRFEAEEEPKKFEETQVKLPIDSDEEDYSFEDVVKAASKNVKEKELEKKREIVEESMKFESKKEDLNLDDTKAIISNIMSNINKNEVAQGNLLGLGLGGGQGLSVSSADLAKTLNSIPVNMASLANIVGSVQSMTKATMAPSVNPPMSAAPKSFQPVQSNSFGGFGGPQERPFQGQQQGYQNRPNMQFGVNYPQNPYQARPNVAYPIDKNKVTYPNYAIYGQQNPQGPPQRPSQPGFGNNQFGNNVNRNNYSRW
ncbi:uncharacterized protein CG7065 homolog isoform X1 [Tribolium castaneum]|uniref:Uncharacterized protein n=2 Tax=Tribolium castaneum TaxID=7070 RepID=D6WXC2_TRICA|nr:uncharacterized protein CG7065 homolog [Tribolium castaneum]XP_008197034.1 PREDICTED: uncharacterized protein CG7065 homolog isoform X1 [Tribolium castaneum]EFA08005.2 hypothetical protein TcasGA2_TC005594 [Tribolium castaneum]|eukprot:NP_001127921.1 uncharacterized protein CG7065 homolog [Tribolium castaneum]